MSTEMEILSAVNGFYENAFEQLLQYTLAIIAFAGVVIPFIVGLIQWRSLKSEKENLEKLIASELLSEKSRIRDELLDELKKLVESEEGKLSSRMEEKFSSLDRRLEVARAGTFHIQGNSSLKASFFSAACLDFCYATEGYIKGNDENNAQRTLKLLIGSGLPKTTGSAYEQVNLGNKIDKLIEFLESKNINGRYTDSIENIKSESKKAKERVEDKPKQPA